MRVGLAVLVVAAASAVPANAADAWSLGSDGPVVPGALARAAVDSFPAPGFEPMGLDWADEIGLMYHVDQVRGDVYSITPEGSATLLFNILEEIGHPESVSCGNGICWYDQGAAGQLYITDFNGHMGEPEVDRVYLFSLDGTLTGSWDVSAIADGVVGITTRYGNDFWLTTAGGEVVKCDNGFQELARYSIPGYSGGGIDYDPVDGTFYLLDYLSCTIRVCDDEMNVLGSFDGQVAAEYSIGVTVGRTTRGRTLWVSAYDAPERWSSPSIFEIDDEWHSPVEPSSWGRIKAGYR